MPLYATKMDSPFTQPCRGGSRRAAHPPSTARRVLGMCCAWYRPGAGPASRSAWSLRSTTFVTAVARGRQAAGATVCSQTCLFSCTAATSVTCCDPPLPGGRRDRLLQALSLLSVDVALVHHHPSPPWPVPMRVCGRPAHAPSCPCARGHGQPASRPPPWVAARGHCGGRRVGGGQWRQRGRSPAAVGTSGCRPVHPVRLPGGSGHAPPLAPPVWGGPGRRHRAAAPGLARAARCPRCRRTARAAGGLPGGRPRHAA